MNIDRLNKIVKENCEPGLFENGKTQDEFWDNEHISKMMLMAHLNPNWDAASRKPETIDTTCSYIIETLKLNNNEKVLDLGCGPGLYSSRLSGHGLNVVGIDYSKRSLNYAKEQAELGNKPIEYLNMNYLDIDYDNEFDLAMIIYCDFGVLSEDLRIELLKKIHKSLKPGGHFVFDVWSTSYDELTAEYKNWNIYEKQGFWKACPHLELINKRHYRDSDVSLKQHIIIQEETETNVYNLWEQMYTVESISSLLNEGGFEVIEVVGDLTGIEYYKESNIIGIVAKKI